MIHLVEQNIFSTYFSLMLYIFPTRMVLININFYKKIYLLKLFQACDPLSFVMIILHIDPLENLFLYSFKIYLRIVVIWISLLELNLFFINSNKHTTILIMIISLITYKYKFLVWNFILSPNIFQSLFWPLSFSNLFMDYII